jgi:hypothetical protein
MTNPLLLRKPDLPYPKKQHHDKKLFQNRTPGSPQKQTIYSHQTDWFEHWDNGLPRHLLVSFS